MSKENPIIATWQERFETTFRFHPDREAIMERLLDDEPVTPQMLDNWWREAIDAADMAENAYRQNQEAA